MTKTEQLTLTLFSIIANNPDYDTNAVAQYQFSTVCQELFATAKNQEFDSRDRLNQMKAMGKATNHYNLLKQAGDVGITGRKGYNAIKERVKAGVDPLGKSPKIPKVYF